MKKLRLFYEKDNLKISYDPEADVLSVEAWKKGKIDYASEIGNFIVHFTKDNIPLLIEVLEASKVLEKSENVVERAREIALAQK